jgi:signal transduction histidine kinase
MNIFQRTHFESTGPWLLKQLSLPKIRFSVVKTDSRSPLLLFLLLGATIFIANFVITYIHNVIPAGFLWQHALIDSTILLLIISPPIYVFWFGPLWREIEGRKKAEQNIIRLSRELVSASEEERKKLAVELHDECSQRITALQFGIESLLFLQPRSEEEKNQKLADLNGLVQQLSDLIRNFSSSLRPDMLEDLGLVSTLNWHVAEISRTFPGLKIDFDAIGLPQRLPPPVELVLYRVCQESLTNVLKHARADRVDIRLTYSHPDVILSIQDNGLGFSPAHEEDGRHCLGLLGMQERVVAAGGKWNLLTRPGKGTLVRVELPVSR